MHRIVPPTLGALAMLATMGVIGGHIIVCQRSEYRAQIQAAATASIILESIILVISSWLASTYALDKAKVLVQPHTAKALCMGTIATVVATATSIATVVLLQHHEATASSQHTFVLAQSLLLGLACALQISFLVVHLMSTRPLTLSASHHLFNSDHNAWSPASYIKSIRYSQTLPRLSESTSTNSIRLKESPPSMRNKIMSPNSLKKTMSHAVRPISSKTRLLSESERPPRPVSLDSHMYAGMNESFDSWDTSAVDYHNRRAVMDIAVSPTIATFRNLETIPASPRTSRSASPGNALDLPAPAKMPRRAKSFGPQHAPRRNRADVAPPSPSELHIHPLFRSDSPNPPPVTSPGSNILASPEAGQVLPPRQSSRPRSLAHSSSFTDTRASLSSSTSVESMNKKKPAPERKMTPPVPDWLLTDRAPRRPPRVNSPPAPRSSLIDSRSVQ